VTLEDDLQISATKMAINTVVCIRLKVETMNGDQVYRKEFELLVEKEKGLLRKLFKELVERGHEVIKIK
jgi:hypothetical protein